MRTVRVVGLLLGAAIMGALAFALVEDRQARLDGARRQSVALARSADRLLLYELRNLERAMAGVAADADAHFRNAPAQAPALLDEAIAGVLSRQQELESLALYDAQGRALTRAAPDPALPQWTASAPRGSRPLLLGPLQRARDAAWVVPLALHTDSGGWLVARLRTSELQRMITGLGIEGGDRLLMLDRGGTVLARSGTSEAMIGRRITLPAMGAGTATVEMVSELDQVARMATFSARSGYPVVVAAGIGLRPVYAHWLELLAWAAGFALLYWLGLWYLVRRLAAHETARESILEELHASTDWLRQAQLASGTGVWRLEADREQVRASAQAAELFGFEPVAATLPLAGFFARMHGDDRARVGAEFAEAQRQNTPFLSEYRIVLPDGRTRWIKARGAMAADTRGVERMAGTIIDITERREAMERIEQAEAQFRALFERNPLPFWVFDAQTMRFLAVNDAAIHNYGYSRDEFLAMTILEIRPEEDAEAVLASMQDALPDSQSERVWTHLTRDGRRFEVCVHSSSIVFAGRPACLVLAEDVSERMANQRDLTWRATHDANTGMLNVETLIRNVDAMPLASAGYAVAYVQLRGLDLVAPTLGRRAGEAILRAAAERFAGVGGEYGYAAYLPSESFVVVALDASRCDDMLASLTAAIATQVQTEDGFHPLEAWIGWAHGASAGEGVEQVIGNAALAALQARRDGVAMMRFDASMASRASERLALAVRLRHALDRHEFELHFQPIRDLGSGQVLALEALLRWRGPDGVLVPPAQFIPLCEESGLIVPLGEWVLEEAARCHRRLVEHGHGNVAIAVNVSAVQFLSTSLPASLRKLHRAYDLPRGALQVELTESAVVRSPESARAAMQELRHEGVCISIDDFGTGFSSMAYLKNLPLDFLKIDRGFTADVHRDVRNAAICRALISLGHGLGLRVIAEGVECEPQLQWLRANGCDQAQGYHFGRPTSMAGILAEMARNVA